MNPSCSHVTRRKLLDSFGGDQRFIVDLSSLFVDRAPHMMVTLRRVSSEGRAEDVSQWAHALREMVGYFDRGATYRALRALERSCAGGVADLGDVMEQLVTLIDDLCDHVRREILSS